MNPETVDAALNSLKIDMRGLDETDRKALLAIIEKFNGGPVGLGTLAASMSEDIATLEDVIEPFLLREGLLSRTPRGRVATKHAYLHLGLEVPEEFSD
jgi:Holliday junction DNA helicase RuvB